MKREAAAPVADGQVQGLGGVIQRDGAARVRSRVPSGVGQGLLAGAERDHLHGGGQAAGGARHLDGGRGSGLFRVPGRQAP
jgi:hypothetical protein